MISLISGCSLVPKEEEVLAPVLKEPPKVVYNTIDIKTSTFEKKIQVSGSFVSTVQKDLCFTSSSGKLKKINVLLGDHVNKGAILAELFTDNIADQIKEQELVLKKSQLALEAVKLGGDKDKKLQEREIANLKEKLKTMQAVSETYTSQEIKDVKNQIEEKQFLYKNSIEVYQNTVKASQNDIALILLKLNNLKQQLSNSVITAPISGIVCYVTEKKAGENIDSLTTAVSIADPKALQLVYSGDKSRIFRLGMKVNVQTGGYSTEGEVVMTPDNAPPDASDEVKSSIRFKLAKIPPDVSIEASADITLFQAKKDNVIVIDKTMVRIAGDRKFVNILDKGVKKERDIVVGDENETQFYILKGLSVGDKVIQG
jgi:macrolide-specific efflux system membrane fusion protein